MLIALWDLGLLLAILSIILLSSSLILKEKSGISEKRLELTGKVAGLAFVAVAIYLIWSSLA